PLRRSRASPRSARTARSRSARPRGRSRGPRSLRSPSRRTTRAPRAAARPSCPRPRTWAGVPAAGPSRLSSSSCRTSRQLSKHSFYISCKLTNDRLFLTVPGRAGPAECSGPRPGGVQAEDFMAEMKGPAVRRPNGAAVPRSAGNPWLVLVIILTAVFMQLLDTTITLVAVPSIQNSLHSSYGEIQLVVAGYMLGFACVLVAGGRLGDTYGRKRMFLWGMLGFTVASAVCGAAPDALTLICARVVLGMCSGLMFPQVLGIIQVVFTGAQRPKAIGLYGATIGLATILGPVTGGALIQANIAGAGWRSIFYVNVPIGLAALALGAALIPESKAAASRFPRPGPPGLGRGLSLLAPPLVIGRDGGGPPWSRAGVAVSPFVLAASARYEYRRTRENENPLIDTGLLRQRPF